MGWLHEIYGCNHHECFSRVHNPVCMDLQLGGVDFIYETSLFLNHFLNCIDFCFTSTNNLKSPSIISRKKKFLQIPNGQLTNQRLLTFAKMF